MSKICSCDKWKANMPILNGMTVLGSLHGMPYSGEIFEYCPWCGEKLKEETDEETNS